VRIAHFSDLHLLSPEGVRFWEIINKRWIGALNLLTNRGRHHQALIFKAMVDDLNQQQLDHCVCTGDITNLALKTEFAFARQVFDRFELPPEQITVIPGNHDAYIRKGAGLFAEYFEPFHRSDDGFGWPDDSRWPFVRVRGDVAVIGLTTSFQTPWFTAYGRIGKEQCERLAALLSDQRLADKFRIVAIHHPVTGRRAQNRVRGLRDRERFAEIIGEHGAEMVLHGHDHRDLSDELPGPNGPVPVRCIQSASYEAGKPDRRARYRIFDIRQDLDIVRIVREDVRVWDPDQQTFKPDQSRDLLGRPPQRALPSAASR